MSVLFFGGVFLYEIVGDVFCCNVRCKLNFVFLFRVFRVKYY